MDGPEGPAAAERGSSGRAILEELAADPEIEALLDFDPVPRKRDVEGGWTPERQREFIARLTLHGSATKACDEMGKNQTGVMKLYRSPLGASFRVAWNAAVEIAKRRMAEAADARPVVPGTMPPTIDHRRKHLSPFDGEGGRAAGAAEGQILNEHGEWEDEASYARRGEEARDGVCGKLLNARRLYLREIAASPGKRAAFEILTGYPVDWERAARLEPQADEPWNRANQRQPDMILTAENGWSFGDYGYGEDKKAELRRAIDEYRAEEGLDPVQWSGDEG